MTKPPLWPAHLHHFCLETPQINAVVPWYETHLEMVPKRLDDGSVWLSGRQRNIVFWPSADKGLGYNLFIFVRDPDGNPVEMSAELETRDFESPPGEWKTEPRTLNLWGDAWTRD